MMPGGRPTTYDPAYCERVIEWAEQGWSFCEVASALGCARSTLDTWGEAHKEFSEALTRAKTAEQAWWERKGRSSLEANCFNSAVWSKSMSARFRDDYTERKQLEGAAGGAIQVVVTSDDDKL